MVSETWIKYKLEKWFTHQCNYYSYSLLKSARLSQACKTFSLKRQDSFESKTSVPLLTKDSSGNRVNFIRSKTFTTGDSDEATSCNVHTVSKNTNKCRNEPENKTNRSETRWKSLRLSFNRKSEKNPEDRSKPVLPEVLKTYDNGFSRRQSCCVTMDYQPSHPEGNVNAVKQNMDMINFERRQRQFLNELAMKRDQVEELKKELDTANLKIHELTKALDSAKSTSDDHQYNLNLALNNARFFEDQLQAKRDSVMKTRLQQESAVTERESLRELLQKAELQNFNLVQELNELKAQRSCDVAYQKELMNQDAKIRAKIAQVSEALQKLQIDQTEAVQLSNKVNIMEDAQKTVCFYQQELHKCKQNYIKLQEKYIVANATIEMFKKLATDNGELFRPNQETEIIINQWKKATEWYNEQTKIQKEIIENLTESLKLEKESNTKICMREGELEKRNEELQKENQELKVKLNRVNKRQDNAVQTEGETILKEAILVKTEVMEILDN